MSGNLPGSIWDNDGRWNWRVKLPGTDKRKNYPLRLPNQRVALSSSKPKNLAENIAWRMWDNAVSESSEKPQKQIISFNDVVASFLVWAKSYYRHPDGSTTSEFDRCGRSLQILQEQYGNKPIDDVGYLEILKQRDALAQVVARSTVNAYAGVWKRFYAWALERRLCSPNVKSEVWALSPLKKNRSKAREGKPVQPVKHADVKATVARLPPVCKVMVLVHELCGARPGEMCIMRRCDIDMRRDVWIYRPEHHKTEHWDMPRVVALGPRAQELLGPLIAGAGDDEYLFSPAEAVGQRNAEKRAKRKTRVQPSQVNRSKSNPVVKPGVRYDKNSYRQFVERAAKAAGVGHWTPNQLRHACGTRVRRKFGVGAARAVLGHSNRLAGAVTDRYTRKAIEREFVRDAGRVMARIG